MQGVGFRPFTKRLADRLRLAGLVANTHDGVLIEVDVPDSGALRTFINALHSNLPRAAIIESCDVVELQGKGTRTRFDIVGSRSRAAATVALPPDLATCSECLRELRDSADPRYRHPFINCTNCGPRFSIITAVPYDRVNTTMAAFEPCSRCKAEYTDHEDRRFHAEPIACPCCGPRLWMEGAADSLGEAITALEQGFIVAVRGLGGFQLVCNGADPLAVDRLRQRKRRGRKPLAVMVRDLAVVERHCYLSSAERELLTSSAAPIVLLRSRAPHTVQHLAPGLSEVGVMLPYTPLHHLLFDGSLEMLVATSGNVSEEPIISSNTEALQKLSSVADRFLFHNREIFMRVDDSVVRETAGCSRILRRARGYTPDPIELPFATREILACGGEMKGAFCLARGTQAILSQHLGDMGNLETLQFFEEALARLKSLYGIEPKVLAHDLHPDYTTSRWAARQGLLQIPVQHHHAHIASCMAEHRLNEKVIGVAFDGTGYGTDGHIWGGEFLLCSYEAFERAAHFRYMPLIGGERAIRQPWRMAAAHLMDAFGPEWRVSGLPIWGALSEGNWRTFEQLFHLKAQHTSSCGRLFDAVSALLGCCQSNGYEGEAAILLEAAADFTSPGQSLPVAIDMAASPWTIDTRPLIREIAGRVASGEPVALLSRDFHETMAQTIVNVCGKLRSATKTSVVCLSGGTFQNAFLLTRATELLAEAGFRVCSHSRVPTNDGGLALGQVAIAASILRDNG